MITGPRTFSSPFGETGLSWHVNYTSVMKLGSVARNSNMLTLVYQKELIL